MPFRHRNAIPILRLPDYNKLIFPKGLGQRGTGSTARFEN
jgi:hypothetical protein